MLAIIITVFSVILDQLSKYLIVQTMELHTSKPFIPYVLSLYHTRNTGAAFSMLSDQRWVFMVVSAISMVIIVWLLYKEYKRHPLLNVALSMVLGGGIGNMIDRIRLGYVVDFFHVDFVDFAIFNVADSFITVGAILLVVYVIFFDAKVEARIKAEKEALSTIAETEESVLETAIENLPEIEKAEKAEEALDE
jgi:signal peptidase II